MRGTKIVLAALGLLGALLLFGYEARTEAQLPLRLNGRRATFGRGVLEGGFLPDPRRINIRSGGNIDTRGLNLGAGCRGFTTALPDYILDYRRPQGFLRFYFAPNNSSLPRDRRDTTLLINDARGRWHCNDDAGGNFNPMVDINNPPGGTYHIWVGTYDGSGQYINGVLSITELRSNHP